MEYNNYYATPPPPPIQNHQRVQMMPTGMNNMMHVSTPIPQPHTPHNIRRVVTPGATQGQPMTQSMQHQQHLSHIHHQMSPSRPQQQPQQHNYHQQLPPHSQGFISNSNPISTLHYSQQPPPAPPHQHQAPLVGPSHTHSQGTHSTHVNTIQHHHNLNSPHLPSPPNYVQHHPDSTLQNHPDGASPFYQNIPQTEFRIIELNKRLQTRPNFRYLTNPMPLSECFEECYWWERFAADFFDNDSTLTLRSFTPDDKVVEYRIGRTLIPRFFRSYYAGGVIDLSIKLRDTRESAHNTSLITLECDQADITTKNIFQHPTANMPMCVIVHTEGHLKLDFVSNSSDALVIRSWRFYTNQCREYIDRSMTGLSNAYLVEPVTRYGLTKQTLSFLKLCMIMEPMQELMILHKQTKIDPRSCLKHILVNKYKYKSLEDSRTPPIKKRKRRTPAVTGVTKKGKANNVNNSNGNINNNNNNNNNADFTNSVNSSITPPTTTLVEEESPKKPTIEEEPPVVVPVQEEHLEKPVVKEEPIAEAVVEEESPKKPVVDEELPTTLVVEEKSPEKPPIDNDPPAPSVVEERLPEKPVLEEEPPVVAVVEEKPPPVRDEPSNQTSEEVVEKENRIRFASTPPPSSNNKTSLTSNGSNKQNRRRSSERKETLREGLMRTQDFVVAMKDLKKDHPALWRITTGNNLLQQYEPKTQNGVVLYENTNQYAGWNPEIKRDYVGVDVKLTQHTRNNITVERLLLNFQKIEDEDVFYDKHFAVYLQIVISITLDSEFWDSIANEPEHHDYFLTSHRIIEDVLKRFKIKLSNKLKLSEATIKNVEKYPNLLIEPLEKVEKEQTCRVSSEKGFSVQVIF